MKCAKCGVEIDRQKDLYSYVRFEFMNGEGQQGTAIYNLCLDDGLELRKEFEHGRG